MLPAVVTIAEATIPDDSLCALSALLECAADLLGGHAASEWHGQVYCAVSRDVVFGEGGRGREVPAGVHETEGAFWQGSSEGEKGSEVLYAQVLGDGDGYCIARDFLDEDLYCFCGHFWGCRARGGVGGNHDVCGLKGR